MDDYWDVISEKHRDKVSRLATKHIIPVERAFRNILNQIESDLEEVSCSRKGERMLTIRQIESALDAIEL